MLSDALWAIDSEIIDEIRKVKLDDSTGHSRLIIALQVSDGIRRHLYKVLHEGFEAQQRIEMRGRRLD